MLTLVQLIIPLLLSSVQTPTQSHHHLSLCNDVALEGLVNNICKQMHALSHLAFGTADFETVLLKIYTLYSAGTHQNARCIYALSICSTMPDVQRPQVQGTPQRDFTAILDASDASGCSIPDLVIALLTEWRFKSSAYTAGLLQQSGDVLKSLLMHARLPKSAEKAACDALHQVYVHKIKDLVKLSSGWNFSAQRAMPDDIDDFDLEDLALDVAKNAPWLWALLEVLLLVKQKKLGDNSVDDGIAAASNGVASDDEGEAAFQGTVRTPPTSPEQESEKKSNH